MNEDTVILEEEIATPEEIPETTPEESSEDGLLDTASAEENINVREENTDDKKNDVELLKAELDTLRQELEEKKKSFERMSREIGEFSEVFPEKSINAIPDSVWESVKTGIPLAAAYALYERKNALRADAASRINERNGNVTTGPIGRASTENFYTPDEVKAMSRSEVKRNYSKILESMKKWN